MFPTSLPSSPGWDSHRADFSIPQSKGLSPTSLPHPQAAYQFQAPRPHMGLGGGVGAHDGSSGVSELCHSLWSLCTGFQEVGWYPGLEQRYREAIPNATVPNTTCHLPRSDAFHMLRDPVSGDIPWPGLIFGLTVLATWCWCTDQVRPRWASPGPSQTRVAPCGKTMHLDAQRGGTCSGTSSGLSCG